jgi:hypothetical protein
MSKTKQGFKLRGQKDKVSFDEITSIDRYRYNDPETCSKCRKQISGKSYTYLNVPYFNNFKFCSEKCRREYLEGLIEKGRLWKHPKV